MNSNHSIVVIVCIWYGYCMVLVLWCDLVTYLIRVGCVGGYGGREKIFCFRNANRKILNVHGIHLVCWGHFVTLIKVG